MIAFPVKRYDKTSAITSDIINEKFTARKKTLVSSEQGTERVKESRYEFRRWLETIDIRNLIFIDEIGLNLAMKRLYARCIGGERVYDDRSGNKGQNITLIG